MAKKKKPEEPEVEEGGVQFHFFTEEDAVLLVLELMDKLALESVAKIGTKAYYVLAEAHALANMPVKGEA